MVDPKKPILTIVEGAGKTDEMEELIARRARLEEEIRIINEDLAELPRHGREKVAKVIYGLPFGKAPKKTKTASGGEAEVIPLFGKQEPDVLNAAKNLSNLAESNRLVDELDIDGIRERLGGAPEQIDIFLDVLEKRLMGTNEPEPPFPPAAAARGYQQAA
jgi:hypothetical protein